MSPVSSKQNGFSFIKFILAVIALLLILMSGLKMLPAFLEYWKVTHLFDVVAADVEMRQASDQVVRDALKKRMTLEGVEALDANQVEITRESGQLNLSAAYSVKQPLLANVSLLIEFNPESKP